MSICSVCADAADRKSDDHSTCLNNVKAAGSCDCQHRPRWGGASPDAIIEAKQRSGKTKIEDVKNAYDEGNPF